MSRDLRQLVAKLDATSESAQALLGDTQNLVKNVDDRVGPLASNLTSASESARTALETAKTTLDKAQGTLGGVDRTLGSVDRALGGESDLGYQLGQTLQQLAVAVQSIRTLADYLDRHPEALLFGKGAPATK